MNWGIKLVLLFALGLTLVWTYAMVALVYTHSPYLLYFFLAHIVVHLVALFSRMPERELVMFAVLSHAIWLFSISLLWGVNPWVSRDYFQFGGIIGLDSPGWLGRTFGRYTWNTLIFLPNIFVWAIFLVPSRIIPRTKQDEGTSHKDIESAFENLGSDFGPLKAILAEVEKVRRSSDLSVPTPSGLRKRLEAHSSDSDVYNGGPDLYSMSEGKGADVFGLRAKKHQEDTQKHSKSFLGGTAKFFLILGILIMAVSGGFLLFIIARRAADDLPVFELIRFVIFPGSLPFVIGSLIYLLAKK